MGDFFIFIFTNSKNCAIIKLPNKFHTAILGIFFSFFEKGELYLFSAYKFIYIVDFGKIANSINVDKYGRRNIRIIA